MIFGEGQNVGVYQRSDLAAVYRVESVRDGIVVLDDGSRWWAANGRATNGTAGLRMSTLTEPQARRLARIKRLLRLVELATMVSEVLHDAKVTESAILRAEGALLDIVQEYGASDHKFMQCIKPRLGIAEAGALETWRHELALARGSQAGT